MYFKTICSISASFEGLSWPFSIRFPEKITVRGIQCSSNGWKTHLCWGHTSFETIPLIVEETTDKISRVNSSTWSSMNAKIDSIAPLVNIGHALSIPGNFLSDLPCGVQKCPTTQASYTLAFAVPAASELLKSQQECKYF
jgi:hypothetical protein